jgi:hypothetical protein
MTTVLTTDAAAIMRATGLLKAFTSHDDPLVNAIMAATREYPTEQALIRTFGALAQIAGVLADTLARSGSGDIGSVLTAVQHRLITGDVPPPQPTRSNPT